MRSGIGVGIIVKPHKSHTKFIFFHLYEIFSPICDWSVIAVPELPLVNKSITTEVTKLTPDQKGADIIYTTLKTETLL